MTNDKSTATKPQFPPTPGGKAPTPTSGWTAPVKKVEQESPPNNPAFLKQTGGPIQSSRPPRWGRR